MRIIMCAGDIIVEKYAHKPKSTLNHCHSHTPVERQFDTTGERSGAVLTALRAFQTM